jgi:hypothetical protein
MDTIGSVEHFRELLVYAGLGVLLILGFFEAWARYKKLDKKD